MKVPILHLRPHHGGLFDVQCMQFATKFSKRLQLRRALRLPLTPDQWLCLWALLGAQLQSRLQARAPALAMFAYL